MIELEPGMSFRDIYQWLGSGYFFFRRTLDSELEIGRLAGDPEMEDRLGVMPLTGTKHVVRGKPEGYLFPHWPLLGALNLPNTKCATYAKRVQQRQWCRTYNTRQVRLTTPYSWDLAKKNPDILNIRTNWPEFLDAAFNPTYPRSEAEASEMFNGGWVSVALNPQIIVTNTKPRLIYYRGKLAARQARGPVPMEVIDVRAAARIHKAYPGGINV